MRDSFTTDNARDFNARYVQSYGYYIDEAKGTRLPVLLKSIDGDTLYFSDLNDTEFNTRADRGAVFEFMQMTRRIYQGVDGNLYYIARRPARQWQRGISGANTIAYMLTDGGTAQVNVDNRLMRQVMFDHKDKANNGYKLSDQFAIVGGVVYLYNHVIGVYDIKSKSITLKKEYAMFFPELLELAVKHEIGVQNAG
jgi:hypothetical protein